MQFYWAMKTIRAQCETCNQHGRQQMQLINNRWHGEEKSVRTDTDFRYMVVRMVARSVWLRLIVITLVMEALGPPKIPSCKNRGLPAIRHSREMLILFVNETMQTCLKRRRAKFVDRGKYAQPSIIVCSLL